MNRAVISLGTNTIRLLVVRDFGAGRVEQIEHRQIGTRLGEGLRDGGPFLPAAMDRTLEAVVAFARVARAFEAEVSCIATSAMRRASDAADFSARVRAASGAPLEILSGEEEAAASFRGATFGVAAAGSATAVLDIGGGSTECAVGIDGVVMSARSIEIGSVRVGERFPALLGGSPGPRARLAARAARDAVRAALAPLVALAPVAEVRCVAGTPLTIAAVATATHVERVSGSMLYRDVVDATIDRLLDLDLAQRRALPGMLAQRADIIPGGAIVLSEALRALGVEAGLLEANDLLLGYLLGRSRTTGSRSEAT